MVTVVVAFVSVVTVSPAKTRQWLKTCPGAA